MHIDQAAGPNRDQSLISNLIGSNSDAIVGKIDNIGIFFIKTIGGKEAVMEPFTPLKKLSAGIVSPDYRCSQTRSLLGGS